MWERLELGPACPSQPALWVCPGELRAALGWANPLLVGEERQRRADLRGGASWSSQTRSIRGSSVGSSRPSSSSLFRRLPAVMAQNLSIPLAFVCLLHLANEKVSAGCTQQPWYEQWGKRQGYGLILRALVATDRAGVALNLHFVGFTAEGKSLALSSSAPLLSSQNLRLDGTEDLSDVLVKQDN